MFFTVDTSKLFCAFLDYEKAFYTVHHDYLWLKSGINCKKRTMIQAIYQKVKSRIWDLKLPYPERFNVTLGVKQGSNYLILCL